MSRVLIIRLIVRQVHRPLWRVLCEEAGRNEPRAIRPLPECGGRPSFLVLPPAAVAARIEVHRSALYVASVERLSAPVRSRSPVVLVATDGLAHKVVVPASVSHNVEEVAPPHAHLGVLRSTARRFVRPPSACTKPRGRLTGGNGSGDAEQLLQPRCAPGAARRRPAR